MGEDWLGEEEFVMKAILVSASEVFEVAKISKVCAILRGLVVIVVEDGMIGLGTHSKVCND